MFPSRAELLQFSAELMVQHATDRIRAVPPSQNRRDYAMETLQQLLPLQPDSRVELEINLALIAETPALPVLATIRDHAHQQLAELCEQLVQMLTDRPHDQQRAGQARRLHALVDGLAIHLLMQPVEQDSTWALDILQDELTHIENVSQPDNNPVATSGHRTHP